MSLPACQQRVLNAIDESLRASEPRLASMFAIFTRLTTGEEPTGMERLPGDSPWWRSVRQLRTFVLIPVMAAIALSGVLLGVTTRGAQACGAVYAAGRAVAVRSVASCSSPPPGPAPGKRPAARQLTKTDPAAISPAECARPYMELAWHQVCYR
ncbi:MAG: DUF3040 domain-containing protein [Streptosporangiaceae bacterium]|nr:DUF3040 domain-containing protein [Streptosporangiaceae bacterium]MBV9854945.1 DUF3040 domain-containing protein [Streptosporangiaceae bacterium]